MLIMFEDCVTRGQSPHQPDQCSNANALPEEASGASLEHAIDLEQAMSQLDDDRELLLEVIDVFMDTTPQLLQNLRSAASAADAHELKEAAHNLKGAASNICAEPVRKIAQSLEEMGGTGVLQNTESILADLEHQFEKLQEFTANLKSE